MSLSRKILRMVQRRLPQLSLCKDKLVLPPTEHILRAFRFERTPYKGTFYLWRLVLPLYQYDPKEYLDYSKRIPRGAYVHLSSDTPEKSATEVAGIIAEDIPNLDKIRTPGDFLDHVGWMIGNDRPAFLLDLAVTYFLVKRIDAAVASLRQAAVEAEKLNAYYAAEYGPGDRLVEHLGEIRRVANLLAEQIHADPAIASMTISAWERNNIATFELGGTVAETKT